MSSLMDWDSMTGLRHAEEYGEVLWISVHIHEQVPEQSVDFGVRGEHGYQHIVIDMERPPHTEECFICGHEWDTSVDDTFHYRECKRHTPHIKVSNHLRHSVVVEEEPVITGDPHQGASWRNPLGTVRQAIEKALLEKEPIPFSLSLDDDDERIPFSLDGGL